MTWSLVALRKMWLLASRMSCPMARPNSAYIVNWSQSCDEPSSPHLSFRRQVLGSSHWHGFAAAGNPEPSASHSSAVPAASHSSLIASRKPLTILVLTQPLAARIVCAGSAAGHVGEREIERKESRGSERASEPAARDWACVTGLTMPAISSTPPTMRPKRLDRLTRQPQFLLA